MRRTLAAAVFTALSIATAGAQLTIPKEYAEFNLQMQQNSD